MVRRLKGLASIVVALVLLTMTTAVWAREPQSALVPDQSSPGVVSTDISPADQQAALSFWTRGALAAARPFELPSQRGPAQVDQSALSVPSVTGAPGSAAPGAPAPNAERIARAAYPLDWAAIDRLSDEAVIGPTGTSQVYTSYTVNQSTALWQMYPHIWVGRLSFATPGGTSFCSGTSISGNIMLTAAHCIYDSTNNQFYSKWVFNPAYRAGASPYGTFPATSCTVLTAWVNLSGSYAINTWAPYDVGVCKMGKNSAGATLNSAVGYMGRQWNYPYIRHFHDLGYPFNDYNNNPLPSAGQYLRACVAESFQQAAEVVGMGCNYGPGISGGSWTIGYAPAVVTGYANGVNSGLFLGTQNAYGPRFNSNNIVPLCNAVGC